MSQQPETPYQIVGAGTLVATVWKRGCAASGWTYRFDVCRVDHHNRVVTPLLRPDEIPDLVKLCQVLAAELAGDGCFEPAERRWLADLAAALDSLPVPVEAGGAPRTVPSDDRDPSTTTRWRAATSAAAAQKPE